MAIEIEELISRTHGCPFLLSSSSARRSLFWRVSELDRAYRRDPLFGRLVEDRIIWRELIDLELQEADEQIE